MDIFLTDEGAEHILTPKDRQWCQLAVELVTPTCSNHRERLTTAAPGKERGIPFVSTFTRHNLPCTRQTAVYHQHGLNSRICFFRSRAYSALRG